MASTTETKVAEPEQSTPNEQQKPEQKHLALGEDDEFEDFPVDGTSPPPLLSTFPRPTSNILPFSPFSPQPTTSIRRYQRKRTVMLTYVTFLLRQTDWPADQTEAAQRNGETKHLWEESWDDDDTSDDFSNQLKWVVGSLLVSTLLLTALSLDIRPRRRFR
ncbi:hypothetical protein HDV63DRAFT_401257 [Trichoderma sp. SZMC 28014]